MCTPRSAEVSTLLLREDFWHACNTLVIGAGVDIRSTYLSWKNILIDGAQKEKLKS
jgi:hypothetical protein